MGAFLGALGGAAVSGLFGGGSQFGQANQMKSNMLGQMGNYTSQGNAAFNSAYPTLSKWARGATPGYGAQGFGGMLSAGATAVSSAAQAHEQEAANRAARLGNIAGLGATENAASLAGARGGSSATQNAFARQGLLQSQQQQAGLRGLAGLYGNAARTGAAYGGEASRLSQEQMEAAAQRFGALTRAAAGGGR